MDHAVADLFGFHALQLGLPQLDALRANRMPHRWVAQDSLVVPDRLELPAPAESITTQSPNVPSRCIAISMPCRFRARAWICWCCRTRLELARDPHETLREVERVLVPEGRVVICRLQPGQPVGPAPTPGVAAPAAGIAESTATCRTPGSSSATGDCAIGCACSASRSRRAVRLLSAAPVRSQAWLERWAWIEGTGERWWPVFGAVYFLIAVKRVRGMRLVGLARARSSSPCGARRGGSSPA